jgi:hypothetical protein
LIYFLWQLNVDGLRRHVPAFSVGHP